MATSLEDLPVEDGEPVGTEHIAMALTAGEFVYDDGATQRFEPDGATAYVEHGRPGHRAAPRACPDTGRTS